MGRYSSDSDSDRKGRSGSKKSKKKSKSRRRRSRSSSYDGGRSRDSRRRSSRSRSSSDRSRDERRRRHRSNSEDSYRTKRSSRRSTSRSRTPRRYRSRTRSDSRDREYSRSKYRTRSRSRSRDRSSKKKKSSKKQGRSRDQSPSPKREKSSTSKTVKDPCEHIPGFADMTPAQQSRLRIQAAFKVADAATQKESKIVDSPAPDTALDQIERAQVIEDIEDEGFMPSHFSSSWSAKTKELHKSATWPTNLSEQESFHEMAIFGNSNALGLDEKTKKEISDATEKLSLGKRTIKWEERDLKTLAHPNLDISFEEAEKRWLEKLRMMREEKTKLRGL